jgi:hypothetical protein
MTDRELLEKAAKAAGIDVPKKLNNWLTYGDKYGFQWWNMDGTRTEKTFNPLNNDGDALRLAVKLQIQVTPGTYNKDEFSAFKAGGGEAHEFRIYQQDEFASTRRAIVRAAAYIGETI